MISNGEGWHYFAVKKLSALLRGIMSKHHGDFYCLNCLHSFATENKRECHKKVWQQYENVVKSNNKKDLIIKITVNNHAHTEKKNTNNKKGAVPTSLLKENAPLQHPR